MRGRGAHDVAAVGGVGDLNCAGGHFHRERFLETKDEFRVGAQIRQPVARGVDALFAAGIRRAGDDDPPAHVVEPDLDPPRQSRFRAGRDDVDGAVGF